MNLVTAGDVVIHLRLNKINIMNALFVLMDISFTPVITTNVCIETLLLSQKIHRQNILSYEHLPTQPC